MTRRWTTALVAMAAGLTLAGCAQGENPYPPVPPPKPEVMGKPPVTTTPLIWQPGHWDWAGGGYTWMPGTFVPSAGHGNMWMPGYWRQSEGGWVWQPAHWM